MENFLAEKKFLDEGLNLEEAIKRADRIEKRERRKSELIKKITQKKLDKNGIIEKVRKEPLKTYSGKKLKVWIVNGELVRGLLDTCFTEGGNDKVYDFIPENEIWIDDDISQKERKFILLHELHERNLMAQGWPYDIAPQNRINHQNNQGIAGTDDKKEPFTDDKEPKSAHLSAHKLEYFCRRHPEELDKRIEEELNKAV